MMKCNICKMVRENCRPECLFRNMRDEDYITVRDFCSRENFAKLLQAVDEANRSEVVRTLLGEARCRKADPINGCYGRLKESEEEADNFKLKLDMVAEECTTINTIFFLTTRAKQEDEQAAVTTYATAMDIATVGLPPVHPTRLGVALSASSFHYKRGARVLARSIAQQAIAAVGDLQGVFASMEDSAEVATMMGFLRDNLDMWNLDPDA